VTELHDTVQVIKELYATVLERSTSAATIPATGRLQRPLELDLRAPTVANPPAAAPAVRRSESDRTDVSPPTQAEPTKHGSDERFTELPTEAGLDLDLTSVIAATGAGSERADVRPQLRDDPLARRTRQPVADALSRGEPTRSTRRAGRVPAATPPPPPLSTPSEARRAVDLSDEQLTQTPTELAIDIDVGTTTDFSSTIGRGAPAVAPHGKANPSEPPSPPRCSIRSTCSWTCPSRRTSRARNVPLE